MSCVACMFGEEAESRQSDLPFREHIAFAYVVGMAEAVTAARNASQSPIALPLCETHARDIAMCLQVAQRDAESARPPEVPS